MQVLSAFAIGLFSVCSLVSSAEAKDTHVLVTPGEIEWGPAPKALPAGAQAALLFGDPSKEGLFALRLKLPAGYAIPPHTHSGNEVVTVISGTFNFGLGESADRKATKPLPAGSFIAMKPGTAHFAYADEETVIQVTTNGPWGIKWVNPADDPQKTQ